MPTPSDSTERRPFAVPDGGDALTIEMTRAEWAHVKRGLEGAAYFAADHDNHEHKNAYRALRDRIIVAEARAGDRDAALYCVARFLADVLRDEFGDAAGDRTDAVTALYGRTPPNHDFGESYRPATEALDAAGFGDRVTVPVVARLRDGEHLRRMDAGPEEWSR